jgi:hypothetical protein
VTKETGVVMAAPVLDEARRRFGEYALDYVYITRPWQHVTARDMYSLSRIVRDTEEMLMQLASSAGVDDSEVNELVERATALKAAAARIVAVAGLDGSWTQGDKERIVLTERESLELAQELLDPPVPNDALRQAFQDYRAFIGL